MSEPDPNAEAKARRMRNLVLAFGLVLFVILVFVVTLVRMGGDVANRAI